MVFTHIVIVIFLAVVWINIIGKGTGYEFKYSSEARAVKKEVCTCLPFTHCSIKNIVKGTGFSDSRKFTNESKCPGQFEVLCCKVTNDDFKRTTSSTKNKPHKCGYYNNSGTFPWSGKLYYQQKKQGELVYTYKCEFSLIHRQVGLTAAHCLDDDDEYYQQGKYTVHIGNMDGHHLNRTVSEIIIHPKFKSLTLLNDIALLFFMDPIRLRTISLICIPSPSILIVNYNNCLVSTKRNSHIMNNVSIIPRQQCLKVLNKTQPKDITGMTDLDLGPPFKLHKSFMCADGDNTDICDGNCGGALVCPIPRQEKRFQLFGIASREINCKEKMPELYVNLKIFREWIDKEVDIRGLDISAYRC